MIKKGSEKNTSQGEKRNFSICIETEVADWLDAQSAELKVSRSRFLSEVVRRVMAGGGAEADSLRKELRATSAQLAMLQNKYERLVAATKDLSKAGNKLLRANDKLADENERLRRLIRSRATGMNEERHDDSRYFRIDGDGESEEEEDDDNE